MATFLDVTGLQYFTNFFVFIFVWLVIYAVLSTTKILGDNKGVPIIIGLIIALLVIISPVVTGAIAAVSPWFALVFVMIILVLVALKTLGVAKTDLSSLPQLKMLLIIGIIIIFVVGIAAYVREEAAIPDGEELDYSKTPSVIFHPKVLGIVFVLLIAVFTIVLMAGKAT
jgi:hypothetical protein